MAAPQPEVDGVVAALVFQLASAEAAAVADVAAAALDRLTAALGAEAVGFARVGRDGTDVTEVGDERAVTTARGLLERADGGDDEGEAPGSEVVELPASRFHRAAIAVIGGDPWHRGPAAVVGTAILGAAERSDTGAALADARAELEHRVEQLEDANAELERFAFTAAHDLRSPLARIEMAVSALGLHDADDGELIAIARRAAAGMRELIEALLDYATIGSDIEVVDVDLDAVVAAVRSDAEPLRQRVDGEIVVGPLPVARGDRALLRQLLQNLVENGLKFHRPGEPPVVTVAATATDDAVELTVTDNGVGIPADRREDVFRLMVRIDDTRGGGTGIGLATAQKIVARHRGAILVDDAPGGGTTVTVTLPADQ